MRGARQKRHFHSLLLCHRFDQASEKMSQISGFVFGNGFAKRDSMIEFASGFLKAFRKESHMIDATDGVARLELQPTIARVDDRPVPRGTAGPQFTAEAGNDDGEDEEIRTPTDSQDLTPQRQLRRRKRPEKFSPIEDTRDQSVKKSRRSAGPGPMMKHKDTPRPKAPEREPVTSMPPPAPGKMRDRVTGASSARPEAAAKQDDKRAGNKERVQQKPRRSQ